MTITRSPWPWGLPQGSLRSLLPLWRRGGLILALYPLIGLTVGVYVAIPVVAPIALGGFYSFNGMGFYEVLRRKFRMGFQNRPLVYVSTEGEGAVLEYRKEAAAERKEKRGVIFRRVQRVKKGR